MPACLLDILSTRQKYDNVVAIIIIIFIIIIVIIISSSSISSSSIKISAVDNILIYTLSLYLLYLYREKQEQRQHLNHDRFSSITHIVTTTNISVELVAVWLKRVPIDSISRFRTFTPSVGLLPYSPIQLGEGLCVIREKVWEYRVLNGIYQATKCIKPSLTIL